ncbi:hypothetical protein WKI71_39925 [Streptomyces sp. MS1.AVA.1]|uniref:Outer membrane channel protein CpnT-like N-terminal domain-containing protein n=1 Tax=Streptomyces machairae TaxID=3134109 RepID=A0ABU8UTR8_9ACTN
MSRTAPDEHSGIARGQRDDFHPHREKLIDADEDLAYESRRPYSGLGRKLDRMSSLIDKSIHDIAEVMPDDLAKSYAKAMGMLIDDGGKNYLRDFAEQLDKIAEGRRKTSMDIMESKWQVIAEVIRLLIEIAIYLAMSFFTGGASASQIMMAKLRSRFLILTTLTHLLQRLHIAPSLTEAFAEAFTTFAVRLAMMNFARTAAAPTASTGTTSSSPPRSAPPRASSPASSTTSPRTSSRATTTTSSRTGRTSTSSRPPTPTCGTRPASTSRTTAPTPSRTSTPARARTTAPTPLRTPTGTAPTSPTTRR